ncbi:uncharacterized protein LOC128678103 [Plodia interpunctella]|uniref:uncharacterized protein LOC128678103 n=1 Tax=Plodia interpunctella TaxID=58824 RepID=UPI00236757D0|nr:uncharacterized protein LOC128678103 [Plodia interpunctella]
MTEITKEFLQGLLAEEHPDVTITGFDGAPGSKRGDNYTSMVYRISLTGIKKHIEPDGSSEKDEPWEGSIIYKCLPESHARRDYYKSDELFCNEVAFYNKIWPAFSKFQSLWEKVKYPFKSLPKCYLARNDLVVMKDLKQYGFVMPDRRQGLTVEQCYFVLKHLSHFHALSLAMKYHNPEGFYELINDKDGISEVFFVPENDAYYKDYYTQAIKNAITMVEEELANSEDKDKYLEKFKQFCSEDTFFQSMVDLVTPQEPLAVICHGDCWTNNFLFRYVDGDIAEMYVVDFQLVRYASPTLDLAYVMYLCLDKQQRADHLSSLFEYYVDELHARLIEMSDEDSVFHGSLNRDALFEMLQDDFKRSGRFGLGMALDMYPIMTCDSDEAPNVYESETASGNGEACVKPVWTSNATCRRKMTELVQEIVDAALI